MRIFIFIGLLCLCIDYLSAQSTITGIVLDDLGEPLVGTSIVEIDTENGTISDLDGKFKLELKSDTSKVRIQFIGYLNQEVIVTLDTSIILNMQVDSIALGEELIMQVCYFESNVTSIGFNSGVLNNPFGLEVQNIIPYISPIRLNLNANVR